MWLVAFNKDVHAHADEPCEKVALIGGLFDLARKIEVKLPAVRNSGAFDLCEAQRT